MAPKIDRSTMKAVTVRAGQMIKLDVKVSGEPPPSKTFFHNKEKVESKDEVGFEARFRDSRFVFEDRLRGSRFVSGEDRHRRLQDQTDDPGLKAIRHGHVLAEGGKQFRQGRGRS